MILPLLGLIAIVIFTIFVFKTANENRHHALGWGAACLFVGLFLQWVLPIIIVIIVGFVLIVTGTRPENVADALGWWTFGITILCIALSFIGMFQILKRVSRIPDDEESFDEPPPPPTFDNLS
jgi:uncharacterized membrane protein